MAPSRAGSWRRPLEERLLDPVEAIALPGRVALGTILRLPEALANPCVARPLQLSAMRNRPHVSKQTRGRIGVVPHGSSPSPLRARPSAPLRSSAVQERLQGLLSDSRPVQDIGASLASEVQSAVLEAADRGTEAEAQLRAALPTPLVGLLPPLPTTPGGGFDASTAQIDVTPGATFSPGPPRVVSGCTLATSPATRPVEGGRRSCAGWWLRRIHLTDVTRAPTPPDARGGLQRRPGCQPPGVRALAAVRGGGGRARGRRGVRGERGQQHDGARPAPPSQGSAAPLQGFGLRDGERLSLETCSRTQAVSIKEQRDRLQAHLREIGAPSTSCAAAAVPPRRPPPLVPCWPAPPLAPRTNPFSLRVFCADAAAASLGVEGRDDLQWAEAIEEVRLLAAELDALGL